MVYKKQVGHTLSEPNRKESHLFSVDLGSGEPVSRASAPNKKEANSETGGYGSVYFLLQRSDIFQIIKSEN